MTIALLTALLLLTSLLVASIAHYKGLPFGRWLLAALAMGAFPALLLIAISDADKFSD